MVAVDLDAGLLFFFAVGAASELAVFMAGWSSRNKYSLVWGDAGDCADDQLRGAADFIEPVTVVMVVGSLSPVTIVEAQVGYTGWVPHWHVSRPGDWRRLCCFWWRRPRR
jgi:NADH-quinone oxidoreductase subunit H